MSRFFSFGLGASLLAHGAAYAALAGAPKVTAVRPAPSSVEFEVAAAKPAPPPPALAPAPPPALQEQRPSSRAAPPPVIPPPMEPKPAAAVDLSGVTLTNDAGEGGWSSPRGDGSARDAPLGPIGNSGKASHLPEPVRPPTPVAAPGPALVASADLSEKPRPPALDAALRQHYPPEARMRAISGTASLRVRIDADGRVRSAALLSETFEGFGGACRRALIGSIWTPPRDSSGRAVATEVRYTCRFVID